jgi:hypothetical protein
LSTSSVGSPSLSPLALTELGEAARAHLKKAENHLEAAARKAETSFKEHTAVPEAHLEKAEDHLEAAAHNAETQAAERDAQACERMAQAREHVSQKRQ